MSFEAIAKLTDVRAKTFTFNTGDKARILYPSSADDLETRGMESVDSTQERLLRLYQKEMRFELHAKTLSEYYRCERIPRGLRIEKAPTIGKDDPEFCRRWCEILNRCSFDLMLLIVEHTSKESSSVKTSILECEKEIETMYNKEKLEELKKTIQEQLKEFREDLTTFKLRKFRRDTMDYKDNKVYKWFSGSQGKPQVPRSREEPTDSSESYFSSSSTTSSNPKWSFLGTPRRSQRTNTRRGVQPGEVRGGEKDV
ncbi:hypothetical protein ABG768_001345 [Culter alburnus]|uniref:Uncharacterized protein n=1 Tax=Culter alburnus TaxID=194366 RepID=A0AAW2B976_CULAL